MTDENKNNWYPPGHGNFYEAFSESGLLDSFVGEGKEFCFISNMDNVGATVDLDILQMCLTGDKVYSLLIG